MMSTDERNLLLLLAKLSLPQPNGVDDRALRAAARRVEAAGNRAATEEKIHGRG